ncbi:MAG TPA: UDP-N-acetylglucosamine 2-epimerase (non-hydrolyzing) [Candidatus Eremiobacteraeota bacterium]|nr:MAG: UDP-N-acetylglucosamine 2-epimerase [bacterium ADurb.Bin363]HPZ08353.1 UDP-N-acetylglucosamine 2-epimerase (non-hydrolyzing) [Candidatus Eremiobacteraeota bacterium]
MAKIKIVSIFGTRPEAIKMAPVVSVLKSFPEKIFSLVLVTAQHREMLDQFLNFFSIKPDYDLNIMQEKQTLSQITCRALVGVEKVLKQEKPDLILVQGDTTTVFAASLAAFYQKVKVGHIEAGLRTDDKYNPFPEEINRRIAGVLADLHFAPTVQAKNNLLCSGIAEANIFVTGNTVIDALFSILTITEKEELLPSYIYNSKNRLILVEAHRRENWKDMTNICEALTGIIQDFPDTEIVFPVHRNPVIRETVYPLLEGHERIHLIEPVDYPTLINLQKRSYIILTDSGGIQEEAPSLGKPVLVLRRTTERPEGIEKGTAKLVGTERENIYNSASLLLKDREEYRKMSMASNPYGDGRAALRIVEAILYRFGFSSSPPEEFNLNNEKSEEK